MNLVKLLTDEFYYYTATPHKRTIELWVEDLKNIPIETVERGIKNCRRDAGRSKPPTPWEIKSAAAVRYPELKINEPEIDHSTLDRLLQERGVSSIADLIKQVPADGRSRD